MTPDEIKQQVLGELDASWAFILERQEAYKAENGKFWQGLITHSVIPSDGVPTAPDRGNTKPTDIDKTWGDLLPPSMSGALRIDAYQCGTNEFGFVARLFVVIRGELWTYGKNHGHCNWLGNDWLKVSTS